MAELPRAGTAQPPGRSVKSCLDGTAAQSGAAHSVEVYPVPGAMGAPAPIPEALVEASVSSLSGRACEARLAANNPRHLQPRRPARHLRRARHHSRTEMSDEEIHKVATSRQLPATLARNSPRGAEEILATLPFDRKAAVSIGPLVTARCAAQESPRGDERGIEATPPPPQRDFPAALVTKALSLPQAHCNLCYRLVALGAAPLRPPPCQRQGASEPAINLPATASAPRPLGS